MSSGLNSSNQTVQRDEALVEIKKSASASQLIEQFENKANPKGPVLVITDEVPINSELALAKEDLLLNYYFGLPTVSAGDFVNSDLDSMLFSQLETESDLAKCQAHVAAYLCNYTNWACLARMHSHKTQLKV